MSRFGTSRSIFDTPTQPWGSRPFLIAPISKDTFYSYASYIYPSLISPLSIQ
jgi:hypothetical protein